MANVSLQRVCKSYSSGPVVSDVDISIAEGEFLVLLGPSGCGKTTTLRMIAGFVEPTSGEIRIDGQDVTWMPPRKRDVGMVFQDYSLFPNMTVWKNVAFGLEQRKVPSREIARRVGECLDMIRLPDLAQRYPDELSGGQKQRVALARALATRPRVLLMDEPLGALDLKLREAMQAELARLQRELGITTVMVTHDQQEAMSLADRIVVMNGGRVQQTGTPEDIYLRPANPFVAGFIGKVNLIEGTVMHVAGDGCMIDVGGARIAAARHGDMVLGARVALALRPETLRALPPDAPPTGNRLDGVVTQRRFLGNAVHYHVDLGAGGEIVVERSGDEILAQVGERIGLAWPPGQERCFALDARPHDPAHVSAQGARA
ncbi:MULTISPECIES: ABC transporter ATP-binding protein [unclassified Caballeronia]|uniref:ABC transporter ATP-binding protein n=1 Tax=unclassified Caballeronia TaxID=2646786 RepID=UPI00285FEEFA|nr:MULTISPECIES: ABC transporter ATP-binding protein [unclassified Caballeronia]MDR5815092.1 ABC transporter ATP-binding protein [Caballeronia sp. LZ033]MDR5821561.1 ABC transporter ATP-binding protein [Caballeronia sp. LZ043]